MHTTNLEMLLKLFFVQIFHKIFFYSDKNSKRARDLHLLKKLKFQLKEANEESGEFLVWYISSVYSPFSDRVVLPLHNIPSSGVLMKCIGAEFL